MSTVKSSRELALPDFFNDSRKRADKVWKVGYEEAAKMARAWAKRHNLKPAASDSLRICLMLIDCQNTFCLPEFELPVAGAVDDCIRTSEFIYRNLALITEIDPTLDTHTAMQIFHSIFLVNDAGEHPNPGTMISLSDVERGVWRVNPAVAFSLGASYMALQSHLLHYARKLSQGNNKYPLMVWPYHAMLGGIGHALVAVVEEACFFHNIARSSQTGFQIKGGNPLTENYSILRPEVLDGENGKPIAQKNVRFIEKLLKYDVVVIAGQAKSHCVAWTIDDLLTEIVSKDKKLAEKVYLLEDCTSPVIIPGVIDFTADADAAFRRFADAGMHVVKSTDPIEMWPGVSL